MTPKIGPSTIAMLTGAVVVMVAFIDTWAEGSPNLWLAALGVLRSWQAVASEKGDKQ
jgi:hypothetical protein